ncbi:hypothetical protein FB45DRAFT_1063256 [Roridomyces roridus]|uniref:Uncharacterized protein n=1 Tax=Roridomyces roridus TaxID=1738132 RepID=A0AAD7BEI0_9AGAR|nr:hypothetical protein FB45DRAFT_1063256 [Roridomyces roridus]
MIHQSLPPASMSSPITCPRGPLMTFPHSTLDITSSLCIRVATIRKLHAPPADDETGSTSETREDPDRSVRGYRRRLHGASLLSSNTDAQSSCITRTLRKHNRRRRSTVGN